MINRAIVMRSIKVALIVGSLLVAINYGHKIVTGNVEGADWLRMALTYVVPFFVSLYGAYTALKQSQ